MGKKKYVVAVHGVGETQLGDTLNDLAKHFSTPSAFFGRDELIINSVPYPRLRSTDPECPELIEVNWCDVSRPRNSLLGIISHLGRLMTAMLYLSDQWHDQKGKFTFATIYRWLLEGLTIWQTFLVIYVLHLACADQHGRWGVTIVGTLLVVATTIVVKRWSKALFIGGIIASIMFIAAGIAACWSGWADRYLISGTTILNSLTHLGLLLGGVILLPYLLFNKSRVLTREQRFARIGLVLIPFISLSILGASLWAISVALVSGRPGSEEAQRYKNWESEFIKHVNYNVWHIEVAMTIVIALIGFFGLIVAALYVSRRSSVEKSGGTSNPANTGLLVRNFLSWGLVVMPWLLFLPGLLAMWEWWTGIDTSSGLLAKAYSVSWLRITPWLAYLTPVMIVTFDILGDVVFLLMPEKSVLSTYGPAIARLKMLIDKLIAEDADRIVIVSHSLGTVVCTIVLQVPGSYEKVDLITMGSPLDALHGRFLNWTLERTVVTRRWHNFYRNGDYIGGQVKAVRENDTEIPKGGHVNYWGEPSVLEKVSEFLR